MVKEGNHRLGDDVINEKKKIFDKQIISPRIAPKNEIDPDLKLENLMKAQWLDHELDRIPYFDLTGKSFIPKSDKTLKVKK
jgi:hypothetical protein